VLNAFSYLNIVRRSKAEPQLISTYPEAWTSRYLRERFEKYDPVIIRAKQCSAPFEWGVDKLTTTTPRKGREIFEEAAHHGIRCGFSIPISTAAGLFAAVSFATDERKSSFQACIKHGTVLQFMSVLFHRQIRSLAARERQVGDTILSLREFECLDWASRGKSAWEISCILKISRATVAFHLENAKRKLGVKSITQAVARFASSR